MSNPVTDPWGIVIQPEAADSYWQPLPSRGYVNVALHPGNTPYDGFSAGLQVLPPGCHVREHGHLQNHELIFIAEGEGYCEIEGRRDELRVGTTVLFGRNARHVIYNTGTVDMRLYWVFMPPGLEDWFAAIGRPRSAGDSMPEAFQRPDNVAEVMARMRFVPPRARQDDK
ncbi:MAG: cupin domain-containing protein [Gammaproteobacteria bacterium]|nr:cupin domain-containing protein [Gammaproteobacteria bacterium]